MSSLFGFSFAFGFRSATACLLLLSAASCVSCAFPDHTFTDEKCFNGVDDDGNGLVDCDDPGCAALVKCVPPPWSGWSGPISIWQGVDPNEAPSCDGTGFPHKSFDTLHSGPISDPVSCPQCGCSSPSGASSIKCVAALQVYSNDNCGGPHQFMYSPDGAQGFIVEQTCTTVTYDLSQFQPGGLAFSEPYPVDESCGVTKTGSLVRPPITYEQSFEACDLVGATPPGGCTTQQTCVPKPKGPFSPQICIYKQFDDADPGCTGDYYTIPLLYSTYADNRGCKECACEPTGVSCEHPTGNGYGAWYSDPSCSTPLSVIQGGGSCVRAPSDFPNVLYVKLAYVTTSGTAGPCQSSGGLPIGEITPLHSYRLCCTSVN